MALDPYVKLLFGYYDDVVISTVDDAAEVMFTRGIAYCGESSPTGFIPVAKLLSLCRKRTHQQAVRVADNLCKPVAGHAAPWSKVKGGYKVRNFARIQEELISLQDRRKADAARQRRKREKGKKESRDNSRDRPTNVTDPSKSRSKDAAAAASTARSSGIDLPVDVQILASKMSALTALSALRWDITPAQLADIQTLIGLHGDQRLVDIAVRTCRTPPPIAASAFIGTWQAMPAPGHTVQAVSEPLCPECNLTIRACDTKAKSDPAFCPRTESA